MTKLDQHINICLKCREICARRKKLVHEEVSEYGRKWFGVQTAWTDKKESSGEVVWCQYRFINRERARENCNYRLEHILIDG